MNRTIPVLLSSILSTVVVTTVASTVHNGKLNTYVTSNLTQLETMIDGWKSGYELLKSHLETEVNKANTEIQRLDGIVKQYEGEMKTIGNTIKSKVDAHATEYNQVFGTSVRSEELAK